jgi:transcription elongation factor Elf1
MRIIKRGNIGNTQKFTCAACGCIFEAERSEWELQVILDVREKRNVAIAHCPDCGAQVVTDIRPETQAEKETTVEGW